MADEIVQVANETATENSVAPPPVTVMDTAPIETVESLLLETEQLKAKLEEERKKLNDVSCKYSPIYQMPYCLGVIQIYFHNPYSCFRGGTFGIHQLYEHKTEKSVERTSS